MVLNQEIVRMGGRGYGDGLNAGMVIGLPPVMNFGKEPLRTKVLDEVFSGQKVRYPPAWYAWNRTDMQVISLAISEAFAGSDVAGLRTVATKNEDGKTWTINGTKKWISGGVHSDYFTVGCKVSHRPLFA